MSFRCRAKKLVQFGDARGSADMSDQSYFIEDRAPGHQIVITGPTGEYVHGAMYSFSMTRLLPAVTRVEIEQGGVTREAKVVESKRLSNIKLGPKRNADRKKKRAVAKKPVRKSAAKKKK